MAKGSNLSLPKSKQSQHVSPKKDTLAGNVGGSAHMSAGDKPNLAKNIKRSGGRAKK